MQSIGKCMHQNDLRLLAKFNPRICTEGLKVNYLKSQENFVTLLVTYLRKRLPLIILGSEEGGMVI